MRNKKILHWSLVIVSLVIASLVIALGIYACGKLSPFFPSANTDLTSTTFSLAPLSAQGVTALGTYEGGWWKETPSKITGEVGSVFFIIENTTNDGIVVYGASRPDLMRAFATLYPFDLSRVTRLFGSISHSPWYQGGFSKTIIMAYGYFDVSFTHAGTEEVVRFAYGNINPYKKGDVLLKNKTTGDFEWFNTSTEAFVSTRPNYPKRIDIVATYVDPQHPETTDFFPLCAKVTNPAAGLDLSVSRVDNYSHTFTVDFNYTKCLWFDPNSVGSAIQNNTQFNALSMAQLIKGIDMSQNKNDWYHVSTTTEVGTVITCTVTDEATPTKGGG